jgi:hypothetical protein
MGKALIAQDLCQHALGLETRRDHRDVFAPGQQAGKHLQQLIGGGKIYSFHCNAHRFEKFEHCIGLVVS